MGKRFTHRNKAVVAGLATAAALAGGVGVAAAGGPSTPPDSTSEAEEGAEKQEGSRLPSDAKVAKQQAEGAALQAVPGTVTASELGNENGSLVWEVDVQEADGTAVEVTVDAGDGTVLAQEADDEGVGASESEAGEQDEAGEATTG